MIDSAPLGGVVGEGRGWSAELVVEADAGGEDEEAEGDACGEVVEGAGAVSFEGEDVFAGAEDRFDALPDGRQVWPLLGFVAAGGAEDGGAEVGDGGGEVAAGVAFVADDRL